MHPDEDVGHARRDDNRPVKEQRELRPRDWGAVTARINEPAVRAKLKHLEMPGPHHAIVSHCRRPPAWYQALGTARTPGQVACDGCPSGAGSPRAWPGRGGCAAPGTW